MMTNKAFRSMIKNTRRPCALVCASIQDLTLLVSTDWTWYFFETETLKYRTLSSASRRCLGIQEPDQQGRNYAWNSSL